MAGGGRGDARGGARSMATSPSISMAMIFAALCGCAQGAGNGACYAPETAGIAPLTVTFEITKECCPNQFDFVVNIHDPYTRKHMCTGALVAPQVVATTATCLDQFKYDDVKIREFPDVKIGGTEPNDARQGKVVKTCQKIVHENFDPKGSGGPDLALVIMDEKAVQDPITKMVPLAECPNNNISFVGWFHPAEPLRGVPTLIAVPNENCEGLIGDIHEGSVCARTDPSQEPVYDEGGLLLCDGKDLVGLASRTKLGPKLYPIAFTEVARYKEWIDSLGNQHSTVRNNKACEKEL
ncbi:unnamed protein product [Ostreobium quekettii]|uniref:Peptidase S1 domain-containing protein n=1 Tax=Ostreobium quekettii TaxID=121088 RepID=A0A8S1IXA8_9CHLO|nr:unnamed protein product [Ostreobium quekettii]